MSEKEFRKLGGVRASELLEKKQEVLFGKGVKITGISLRIIHDTPDEQLNTVRQKLGYRNALTTDLKMYNKPYKNFRITDLRKEVDIDIKKGETISEADKAEARQAAEKLASRYAGKDIDPVNIMYQVEMEDETGYEFAINLGKINEPADMSDDINYVVDNLDYYQTWVDNDKKAEY